MNEATHKGRRTLLLLAVVFLGPMAVAMVLYYTGFQWRPEGTTEHGVLYRPPRPMPDLAMEVMAEGGGTAQLHGKWTLIYAGPGACDADCRQALVTMRQVRRALGRDLDRVQRLYLVTGGTPDTGLLRAEHPGTGVIAEGPAVTNLTRIIGETQPGDIFLSDPLGNLVMRYPAGSTMKDIHTDLKHLLKISTIG